MHIMQILIWDAYYAYVDYNAYVDYTIHVLYVVLTHYAHKFVTWNICVLMCDTDYDFH